jgi:H+-transporting ATPase
MTGDGVNDAPALKQAEVGIAVTNATDVAKAAASVILTNPGLTDAVAAVEVGRRIYQRMLTYTLNKIVKTLEVALLLSFGLLVTGVFVTTPHLIVLLLFTNDFVTMALATDHVSPSRRPERWRVGSLVSSALALAAGWLLFSFAIFFVARDVLGLDLARLQTLIFVMLVFSGQATVYLVRERRHLWSSAPSRWVLAASAGDVLGVSLLATSGILMRPLPACMVAGLLLLVALYTAALDLLKTCVFHRLGVR